MITNPSSIPQNSTMPVPKSQVEWDAYVLARSNAAGIVGKLSYQCSSPLPSSFVDLGQAIVTEVGTEQQAAQQNLLTRSDAVQPAVAQTGQAGAVISDQAIAAAPQVVPMSTAAVASMLPLDQNTIAAAQARQARRHTKRIPGSSWGTPAVAGAGSCGSSFRDRLRANPWGTAFLVAGLGIVAYSAVKGK